MKGGRVARRVMLEPDGARAAIDASAADETVEVALLIFPTVTMSAAAFDAWCAPLRAANPAFVAAVFHPETPYELTTPAQAVGLFRRAPDPTLQLVRASLIDRLRGDASAEVGRANLANVTARGLDALDALLVDIRSDRDAAYARLC